MQERRMLTMKEEWRQGKDDELVYLDPSVFTFPQNEFAIDHQSSWKPLLTGPATSTKATRTSLIHEVHQYRNDESCFERAVKPKRTSPSSSPSRLDRGKPSHDETVPSHKRSRRNGSVSFSEECEEASKLELYAIQLFTLVLARFNKSVGGDDDCDDSKLEGDDYFILSSFQKLKDFILCEMRHIEKKSSDNCRDDCDKGAKNKRRVSFIVLDGGNLCNDGKDCHGSFDPFNWKVDGKVSSNEALLKFNNMLFLLLGYAMPKIDLNVPHFYMTKDQSCARLTKERCVIIKCLLDLIDLLYQYNSKRYDIWIKNFRLQNDYMPFQLSENESNECFTTVQQVLYQIGCSLLIYLSTEEDFTVTSLIETFSIIETSVSIMQSLETVGISGRKSPTRNVNLLDLIITVVSTTNETCIQNNVSTELDQNFNTLIEKILAFLHLPSDKSTHSIISSCAQIVFHLEEENTQNEETVQRNYDLLMEFLSSMQQTSPVITTGKPNWTSLFDAMNSVLNDNSKEVKKILIMCNYLIRSKNIRSHLSPNKSLLKTILKYTTFQGSEDFNQSDINWINTKAIRILTFLISTDVEESIFDMFVDIATIHSSMTVKAEFILGIDLALKEKPDYLVKYLDTSNAFKVKCLYDVYRDIATYDGVLFPILPFARRKALESLCALSCYIRNTQSYHNATICSIESFINIDKSYEETFIKVVSKDVKHLQSRILHLMKSSSILDKIASVAMNNNHTHEIRENAMLVLRMIAHQDESLLAMTTNEKILDCLTHYFAYHGRSKKCSLIRYCTLDIASKMAESSACRQHLITKHSNVVNFWMDSAIKTPITFESHLDKKARDKANIVLNETRSLKNRLHEALSGFVSSI